MKRQIQDVGELSVMKDMDGNIMHGDKNIKRRQKDYFQLLNTENEREELDDVPKIKGSVMVIKKTGIK